MIKEQKKMSFDSSGPRHFALPVRAERQNVTLSISKSLLKRAKIMAAQKDVSLSELMRKTLESVITQEARYQGAKERQSRLLEKGLDLGTKGRITWTRDELHARK